MTQNPDKVNKCIKCWLCKNQHRLMNSEQFLSKSLTEKKDFVKERLCFNCLSKCHVLKDCKSNFFFAEGCKKSTILSCMKKTRQGLMSVALNITFQSLTCKFYKFMCQTVMFQWNLTNYLTLDRLYFSY